ncbi:MAG: hypothetical protein P8Y70_06455 [Candidatus Lokiarchaeota archaeon]
MIDITRFSGSKFEDIEAIARISVVEQHLLAEFEEWFREILRNFYMVQGYIYSEKDRAMLIDQKRPDFQWNLFRPILNALSGNFKNSAPGIDVLGVTQDDHQLADFMKALLEMMLFQKNDFTYELSKAYLWALIARIGWLCSEWSFEQDKEGMFDVRWYDSFRLKFDTTWQRRNMRDLKYMDDSGWLSPEEIIMKYARNKPDLAEEIEEKSKLIIGYSTMDRNQKYKNMIATWAERILNAIHPYTSEKKGYDRFNNTVQYDRYGMWYNHRGRFKVVDFYERRPTREMWVYDYASGVEEDITDKIKLPNYNGGYIRDWYDNDKLQALRTQYGFPELKEYDTNLIYQTSVIPGLNVKPWDAPQPLNNKNFKFTAIMAYDFHPEMLETKGVVDDIKDPVRSVNHRRNTMLTILMRMAHGGWIAEKTAVKDFMDEFKKNDIANIKVVADGSLTQNRVREIKQNINLTGLQNFEREDLEGTKYISGVHDNSMGLRENAGESGVRFDKGVAQAEVMQEHVSENAQASMLMVAYNAMALMKRFMTEFRILRFKIEGNDPLWLPVNIKIADRIINDPTVGEYDLQISTIPFGRLAKEREFQRVLLLDQTIAQVDPRMVDLVSLIKLANVSTEQDMIERIKMFEGQAAALIQQQTFQQNIQNMAANIKNLQALTQIKFDVDQKQLQTRKMAMDNKAQAGDIALEDIAREAIGLK